MYKGKSGEKVETKTEKKYIFVTENINYGLTEEDEKSIIRYDLKGSRRNRFVTVKEKIELPSASFSHQKGKERD